jgi:hypothetical protein
VPLREAFSDLKEQAIAVLAAATSKTRDSFLERKLQQIELLKIADVRTIESNLVQNQRWSRDSLAVSQGLRPAPHQSLTALTRSAAGLGDGIDTLEKATREAASHLQRTEEGPKGDPMPIKPNETSVHIGAAAALLKLIVPWVGGLLFIVAGVILVWLGATGDTEFNFFGNSFKSQNVGIASIFCGVVLAQPPRLGVCSHQLNDSAE